MADVILMQNTEDLVDKAIASERRYADRQNPLEELTPIGVYQRYRFSTDTIYYLVKKVEFLERSCRRSNPLPVLLQVLVTLRFLATNSMQRAVADVYKISAASVCRSVHQCVRLLARMHSREIVFPNVKALCDMKKVFRLICRLPNVVGVIDGSLIKIQRPTINTHEYICQKNYAAIKYTSKFVTFIKIQNS